MCVEELFRRLLPHKHQYGDFGPRRSRHRVCAAVRGPCSGLRARLVLLPTRRRRTSQSPHSGSRFSRDESLRLCLPGFLSTSAFIIQVAVGVEVHPACLARLSGGLREVPWSVGQVLRTQGRSSSSSHGADSISGSFGAAVMYAASERQGAWLSKICFWTFLSLLVWNSCYPVMLFCYPDARWARLGAAFMDIALDVGYLSTYIAVQMRFFHDFSYSKVFPTDFFEYLAVYMNVARIFCVCRALERTASKAREPCTKVPPPAGGAHFRCLTLSYTPLMLLVLFLALRSVDVYPIRGPEDFHCFPGACSVPSSGALRLDDCGPAGVLSLATVDLSRRNWTALENSCQFLLVSVGDIVVEDYNNCNFCWASKKSQGNISSVAPNALQSCHVVEKLYLSRNRLTELPAGLFDGLTALQRLHLQRNHLVQLPPSPFGGLYALRRLDLSHNSFSQIPEPLFRGLSKLEVLWLDHNNLTRLPAHVFDGLESLWKLDLRYNNLTGLPAGLEDANLEHLEYLLYDSS